nr:hypothetical protein Iba_chr07eCG5540 [Ipomoea batatas]
MEAHHQSVSCGCRGNFLISRMFGSKLNSTSLRGKQESAFILICKSRNESFAMHFHTAGDYGHCLKLKTAWKRLDFAVSTFGCDKCQTVKISKAHMDFLQDKT